MRIRLGKPAAPARIDLGGGVWVMCKPLGQLHEDRAQARAAEAARQLAREDGAYRDYGLEDAMGGLLFDPDELDVTTGVGLLLFSVELAMIGVTAWGGFDTEDGRDAEGSAPTRRGLALLFSDRITEGSRETFAQRFITKACTRATLERSEGNGSAAALPGSSAKAADSAPTAVSSRKPVPEAPLSPPTGSPESGDTAR